MSIIFGLLLVIVIFASGAVFWGWYAVPKDRVPPHLEEIDLKRLETEDRLRQTSYQLLAGGALVLTFCLTVWQAATSYNQWSSDYAIRNRQAEVSHLSEVLGALSQKNPATRIAGYYSLRQLVLQYPKEEGRSAAGILAYSIRSIANVRDTFATSKLSRECGGGSDAPIDREDPDPDVQVAMNVLSDPIVSASMRTVNFDGKTCRWDVGGSSITNINLSHLALDNLDLSGGNFDCLDMSQSRFRRANLRHASLQGTNFGGASFDDWKTPGFLETMQREQPDASGHKRAQWLYNSNEWKRYRCWIADFRDADLAHADFSGAGLAGVDFRSATLSDTNFDGAVISRANFMYAKGITEQQLSKACADEQPLLPFNITIKKC
jgi:uncharacterized protein YjbI with pentapeptide repeats